MINIENVIKFKKNYNKIYLNEYTLNNIVQGDEPYYYFYTAVKIIFYINLIITIMYVFDIIFFKYKKSIPKKQSI